MIQDHLNPNSLITVTLFGKFELSNTQGILDTPTIASDKITALLCYLIHHHERPVPTQELYEILWPDLNCKNPAGALKNLIYRCRLLLRKYLGNHNYILTTKGSYIWNSNVPLLIDSETFETAIKKADNTEDIPTKIKLLDGAVSLYNGKFLSHLPYEYWTTTLTTYYHGLFLKCCKCLADNYEHIEQYEDMAYICKHGLNIDSLDESLHYYLMKAYIKQNNTTLAIEHYQQASKELQTSLGITSPTLLERLYQEIVSLHKIEQITLQEVATQLQESEPTGAFLCDFGVFKDIYRIEARRVQRLGILEHIVLFTLEPGQRAFTDVSVQDKIMKKASSKLERLMQDNLRLGDVITKFSDFQIAVLLPACTYEESSRIALRIKSTFYGEYRFERIRLTFHLDELSVRAPYL